METVRYRELVEYLDILKPIILLNIELLRSAHVRFLNLTTPLDLDEFELTIEDTLDFFPDCASVISPIVHRLAVSKPLLGPRVYLLDVLTMLVILMRGDMHEKAQLIFTWYNFSRTGLMSELEHTLLITRAAECLHRLKLLGAIEITRDDSRHIALAARIDKQVRNKIFFKPGLTFDDFFNWIEQEQEGESITRAFKVFGRLSDVLISLQNRVSAIYQIIERKQQHEALRRHVPSKEILGCSINPTPVIVISRGTTKLSMCIRLLSRSALDVYVCQKQLFSLPSPHYQLPTFAEQRIFGNRVLPPKCCQKQFHLTSYLQLPRSNITTTSSQCDLVRIDLENLDADQRYEIEVYTQLEHFHPVLVQTLPPLHQLSQRTSYQQVLALKKLFLCLFVCLVVVFVVVFVVKD